MSDRQGPVTAYALADRCDLQRHNRRRKQRDQGKAAHQSPRHSVGRHGEADPAEGAQPGAVARVHRRRRMSRGDPQPYPPTQGRPRPRARRQKQLKAERQNV